MNYKKHKIKLIQLLLCTLLITTLISCNQKERAEQTPTDTVEEQTPAIEEPPVAEPAETIQDTNTQKEIEPEVFDDTTLGYEVKDDQLYLNEKALPAGKISETTKEKDRTTYHFYDGAALIIKSNGDIVVNFPIHITLLVDKDFTTFETLYRNKPLTNATIFDFKTEDNWYTIDYGENTSLKFNNDTLIFNTNNLEITQKADSCETVFKDFVISTSNIQSTDALSNIIKIDYEDGNKLTHIVGGSTTFIFNSGTEIESDGTTTKIKQDGKETILKGDLKGIEYDKNTGSISFETTEESLKIDSEGKIIEQINLVEPLAKTPDPVIDDTNNETDITEETTAPEETIEETPIADLGLEEPITQDIIGSWDEEEPELIPYRIGLIANLSFLQKDSDISDYGLRADLVIENEVVANTTIGIQLGVGADHFSSGFYKELIPTATFAQEFTPKNSNTSYFYQFKLGSLIPLDEKVGTVSETPFFRLGLALGINFNIHPNWMVRLAIEGDLNYRNSLAYSEAAYLGLIYKFK
jgi:hypothetical protein